MTASQPLLHNSINNLQHVISVDLSLEMGKDRRLGIVETQSFCWSFLLKCTIPCQSLHKEEECISRDPQLFDNPLLGDLTLEGSWRS